MAIINFPFSSLRIRFCDISNRITQLHGSEASKAVCLQEPVRHTARHRDMQSANLDVDILAQKLLVCFRLPDTEPYIEPYIEPYNQPMPLNIFFLTSH